MDHNSLLANEQKYIKLNAEIEKRNKQLLKEAESVINSRGHDAAGQLFSDSTMVHGGSHSGGYTFSVSPHKTIASAIGEQETQKTINYCRLTSNSKKCQVKDRNSKNGHYIGRTDTTSNEDDDCVPEVGRGMGAEGLIRFLKAKVKLLQERVDSNHIELKKRAEEWGKLQEELRTTSEEKNRWMQNAMTAKELLHKMEAQVVEKDGKLEQCDTEINLLKKQNEALQKELKASQHTSNNCELKLNRALEETEKLKVALKQANNEDKETKHLARKKNEEMAAHIRRLEKQKNELMLGFKKQMYLIDNLQRQKRHLEAGHIMQFTEEEFLKMLDWAPSTNE